MTDEKRKYKFGNYELDYDNYLKNLDHNVNAFLEALNWNSSQKNEFIDAYNALRDAYASDTTGRFSADAFGNINDSQGIFSSEKEEDTYYDKYGLTINAETYNTLKDRKKKKYSGFNAESYVARYFRDVANAMSSEKTTPTKFEFGKHDFLTWLKTKLNPSGGQVDLTPFHNLDRKKGYLDNENTIIGTGERSKKLGELLAEYMDSNFPKDYDFSNSSFKTADNYYTALKNFLDYLGKNDLNYSRDELAALAAGIDLNFYNDFFRTNFSLETEEDETKRKKEEELKKQQLLEKYKLYGDTQLKIFNDNKNNKLNYKDTPYTFILPLAPFDINKFNSAFNNIVYSGYFKNNEFLIDSFIEDWLKNPFRTHYENHNKESRSFQLDLLIPFLIYKGEQNPKDPNAFVPADTSTDNNKLYYYPASYDPEKAHILVYNATTGKLYYDFIGAVDTKFWFDILKKLNILDSPSENSVTPGSYFPLNKKGGTLKHLQGGSFSTFLKSELEKAKQQRAEQLGNTLQQQRAADRYILNGYAVTDNPGLFTDIELARLGSAAADLASLGFSFAPGAGTAVSAGLGVTSTAANAYADIKDDAVTGWETAGNLLFGLGMDAIGLIPGLGATGKFAKIARALSKVAPKVMRVLAAGTFLSQGDEMLKSWEKMLDSDAKMTASDWENVMLSLNLILGGGAAETRLARNKNKISQYKLDDEVAVKVKIDGKTKDVVVSGNVAKQIQANKDNPAKIKEILNENYVGFENALIVNPSIPHLQNPVPSFNPTKWRWPISTKSGVLTGVYSDGKLKRIGEIRASDRYETPTSRKEAQATKAAKDAASDNEYVESLLDPVKKASKKYENKLKRKDSVLASVRRQKELDIEINKLKGELLNTPNEFVLNYRRNQENIQEIERELKKLENSDLILPETKQKLSPEQLEEYKQRDKNILLKSKKEAEEAVKRDKPIIEKIQLLESLLKERSTLKLPSKKTIAAYEAVTPEGKSKVRLEFERQYVPDSEGNVTFNDPNTGRTIVRKFEELLKDIKFKNGGVIQKALSGSKMKVHTDDEEKPSNVSFKERLIWELNNFFLNPNVKYGIPRAYEDLKTNRQMTNLNIEAEKPILKLSINLPKTSIVSDLPKEIASLQAAARLLDLAETPLTSDGRLQTALQFDSQLKGLDMKNQGKQQSDETSLSNSKTNREEIKEELKLNNTTINSNNAAMMATANNKTKHKLAGMAKEQTIKDTLSQQFENDYRTKLSEGESAQKAVILQDLQNKVIDDVLDKKYTLFSPALITLLQKYKLNNYSAITMTDNERTDLAEVKKIVDGIATNLYWDVMGLPRYYKNPLDSKTISGYVKTKLEIAHKKKGGKLEGYKIILAAIKENNKKIDKISKSMINYFKDIK